MVAGADAAISGEASTMKPELFIGDADGPEHVIDTASDGTTLMDCRG